MINNILDQNGADSIAGLFSLFDLSNDASKESRIEKLSKLHSYGILVIIKYLVTNELSKAELTCDFEKIYCKMNEMSLQLDKKSQVK